MTTETNHDLLKDRITKLKARYIWRTKRDYASHSHGLIFVTEISLILRQLWI